MYVELNLCEANRTKDQAFDILHGIIEAYINLSRHACSQDAVEQFRPITARLHRVLVHKTIVALSTILNVHAEK